MDRLVYDAESKTIIARIRDCEGTSTGTPFEMVEGTPEEIDRLIAEMGLAESQNPAPPPPAP